MKPLPLFLSLVCAVLLLSGCAAPQTVVNMNDDLPPWDPTALEQPPRPTSMSAPIYPAALRRAEITGEVLVEFVVTSTGQVTRVRAVESTNPEFSAAAEAAVRKWRFQPGMKDGQAVNTLMAVPMVFDLEPEIPEND